MAEESKNKVKVSLVGIEKPSVKWEQDDVEGGARQVAVLKFRVPNLPLQLQQEMAAHAFAGNVANLEIEFLQPSFYMSHLNEDGQITRVNGDTGEIAGS